MRVALVPGLLAAILTLTSPAYSSDRIWPKVKSPVAEAPEIEAKVQATLSQMSLEQKVGQIIQAEVKHISPEDAGKYHIGSVLNGGGSWPTGEVDGPLGGWLSLANLFYKESMQRKKGRLAIPILWGTDAVHGHNNVQGATIFPHNIGLGAANNLGLMRDIGTATAREIAVTGIDWAFAPTVAAAQDIRWGRTYESYSSDPNIVAELSKEMLLGLQGHPALGNFLSEQKVIATAKHFIGDGGTQNGDDQGNTVLSERELYKTHGQGYVQTIGAGVQTVMASFNSWNGNKIHGSKYLLTDVLKEKMGFDGFVVGDWNGHEQVEGCSKVSCPAAINAGIDMIMVPEDWKPFLENTIRQVKSGEITQTRLDDAVRRILRVKYRAGMFDDGKPSKHALAGRASLVGHPEHRAVARQAVRESLVLLKNDGVLPLSPESKIIVAGSGADNPSMQSGGWTLTWQGRDMPSKEYKGFTTIKEGFEAIIGKESVLTDAFSAADAAIVVFGETPYAEFEGDLGSVDFDLTGSKDYALIQSFKSRNIPVVAVFLSGRPRGIDEAIESSDAFVAAWLPGSEGAGVADVLIKNEHGFKGKLPFDWPATSSASALPKYKRGFASETTARSRH
jgi:beta-glucosidase